MSSTMFSVLSTTLLAGVGILAIIYLFASARILFSRVSKEENRRDLPFMFLIFSIWVVAFFLVGYIPDPFSGVGWSLAGGAASIVTYAVMSVSGHKKRVELLLIGFINILATLPVLLYGSLYEVEITVLVIYIVSFIFGGAYSTIKARRYLEAV